MVQFSFYIWLAIIPLIKPEYEGGYPIAKTAEAAFEEYDYQAATWFYIWGYA